MGKICGPASVHNNCRVYFCDIAVMSWDYQHEVSLYFFCQEMASIQQIMSNKIPMVLINVTCSIPIFRYEAESDKMWIPEDSKYISNKAWIDENFVGTGQRGQYLLFRSEKNILTPDALQNVSRFISILVSASTKKPYE